MYLITKSIIFGEVIAWVYSIEWQKKRITTCSHCNMVKNKIYPNQIDDLFSAELTNPEKDL